jgi:hypothetical protein
MYCFSQKAEPRLILKQNEEVDISMQVKTTIVQQAMGQAIDFSIDATGIHSFRVTNATDENFTLNHRLSRIIFTVDGMGQKRNFDSDLEKDQAGPFGKPITEMISKKYDMIIDPAGNTLMAIPEKIELSASNNQMALIANMLKDIISLVQPPAKGAASFFKVLPDSGISKSVPWTEVYDTGEGKIESAFAVTDINDSTIVVDFAANSVTVSKAEIMGNPTTTTLNNKSTGKIILDRSTGIIREKTINTNAAGNTETSFGTIPVTSKSTTVITVRRK